LPVPAKQSATGTILVDAGESAPSQVRVVLYARVSSADQSGDLDRQLSRLSSYAAAQGLLGVETVCARPA